MKRIAPLWMFALLVLGTGAAWGNDAIVSTVTPLTNPYSNPPIVQINGVSQGNIRLVYTVVGTQFPCGPQNPFATFNLGMLDQRGSGPVRGSYPATLSLADSGNGTPVQLAPLPNSFTVNGIGWSDNSNVSVNIDCGSLPAPADGQVIDGQMNQSTNNGSHLNTISTIQVHIMLVFPTNACVKLYSFQSDQNTFDILTGVTVIPMNSFTKSTDPSSVSVDGMVVNTCTTPQSFDIAANLGQYWQNIAGSSIGSSTYTYTTAGEFDPTSYGLAAWGTSTPQGETLCVKNFTLAPGYSLLMRVYSVVVPWTPLVNLPQPFPYSATLYSPGSNCAGNLLPSTLVGPNNPATSSLPWTY
ncbi:MAG TPA: hypothetical protein VFB04_06270 [Terriglobales bacterium]|nr:hypothetical protein [Terriglobales bacterium]